ncbi:Uu.00g072130.m01.CDS01 [Anthostomella pinea]|uniref:Uu.00g072130.m01.CDS01 n=1 Tax=Anthostomella pinea TaxID=933095 RepID=A0AAI8VV21_9PEZI|nr:Uu.00g072130.m01.CDS01 [Anthostomella pinea]
MPPVDANEIQQFAADYDSGSSDRLREYAFAPSTDQYHYDTTPRQPSHSAHSSYSAMSSKQARSSSFASTAGTASSQYSDQYSGGSSYATGSSGWSTSPSTTAETYAESVTTYTIEPDTYLPAPAQTGALSLPCEFVGLASCAYSFDQNDTAAWIEHTIQVHLHDRLPNKVLCWFCDEYSFDVSHLEVGGDRRLNFEQRMWHIRDHIMEEGKTAEQIRPDFHMLEHLDRHGLITKAVYTRAKRWREKVPPVTGIYAPGYVPEERRVENERRNRVLVDHDKEDRHHRRRHRNHHR